MGEQKGIRNPFAFKQFLVYQDHVALPVTTDACLFGAWAQLSQYNTTVLDIGTGTGLLVFMLAQKYPFGNFTGIDIDATSIVEANKSLVNWKNNGLKTAIQFKNQNFLTFNHPGLDAIICNPPFFSNQLVSSNPIRNRARHTQQLTQLKLIEKSYELLNCNGVFFLMYPFIGSDKLFSDLTRTGFTIENAMEVAANSNKKPHLMFVKAIKLNPNENQSTSSQPLSIHRLNTYLNPKLPSNNPYNLSPESSELLKDYYIKL